MIGGGIWRLGKRSGGGRIVGMFRRCLSSSGAGEGGVVIVVLFAYD